MSSVSVHDRIDSDGKVFNVFFESDPLGYPEINLIDFW